MGSGVKRKEHSKAETIEDLQRELGWAKIDEYPFKGLNSMKSTYDLTFVIYPIQRQTVFGRRNLRNG